MQEEAFLICLSFIEGLLMFSRKFLLWKTQTEMLIAYRIFFIDKNFSWLTALIIQPRLGTLIFFFPDIFYPEIPGHTEKNAFMLALQFIIPGSAPRISTVNLDCIFLQQVY